jgi:hypothetical protein
MTGKIGQAKPESPDLAGPPKKQNRKAMDTCSHCGKERTGLKRCTVCKHAWYCGAACQKAGWKLHKKTCLSLRDVHAKWNASGLAEEWQEVLKWEGRMEELMENAHLTDGNGSNAVLSNFIRAHELGFRATGNTDHALSVSELTKRRVALLCKMERFRDQAAALCSLAYHLIVAGKREEAAGYFENARGIGAAHGFFSAEFSACLGLGITAMDDGREEEGLDLLRNALASATLTEDEDNECEVLGLEALTKALFQTHAIDEVEPLVPRFREAAKAESYRLERLSFSELRSLYASAQLHEVLCTCTLCWDPPTLLGPCIPPTHGVCHRIHNAE